MVKPMSHRKADELRELYDELTQKVAEQYGLQSRTASDQVLAYCAALTAEPMRSYLLAGMESVVRRSTSCSSA